MAKGVSTRRGAINIALNRLIAAGAIAGFRTNYQSKSEPQHLVITVTAAGNAEAIRTMVADALGEAGDGAEIIVEAV